MIGTEVSGHVGADNRGDAEVMDRFGIQDTQDWWCLQKGRKLLEWILPRKNTQWLIRAEAGEHHEDDLIWSSLLTGGERQTVQDGVEEDSGEEEEEKDKDKAEDEVLKLEKE